MKKPQQHRTKEKDGVTVITLTEDESRRVRQAHELVEERELKLQAEASRLRADVIDAQIARNKVMNELGVTYGFDPSAPMRFDAKKRTLTTTDEP